jgi:hypothetical protein
MPRNCNLFVGATAWTDATGRSSFLEVEVEVVMKQLASEQGFGNPEMTGVKLISKNKQLNKSGHTRKLLCYYHTNARGGCKFEIREEFNTETKEYCFLIGTVPHSEHLVKTNTKAKLLINSPSVVSKTPAAFARMYIKKHPTADHKEIKIADETFKHRKYQHFRSDLPTGINIRSRAAVHLTMGNFLYSHVSALVSFTSDSIYLCADSSNKSFVLEEGPDDSVARLVAVFSSEELLLNMFRHQTQGLDIHILLDASYRYTTERGLGYIPVKVASLTQTGRTVAYAVVTKEDSAVHEFVVSAVKASVESVVNRRIKQGDQFC